MQGKILPSAPRIKGMVWYCIYHLSNSYYSYLIEIFLQAPFTRVDVLIHSSCSLQELALRYIIEKRPEFTQLPTEIEEMISIHGECAICHTYVTLYCIVCTFVADEFRHR